MIVLLIRFGICTLLAALIPGAAIAAELVIELDNEGADLDQAVVWLERDAEAFESYRPDDGTLRMDQRDRAFVPKVLAVSKGQSVRFQNSDDVRHHVYSFSEAKRFELPLFRSGESHVVQFDQAGVVVVGCNIHDYMIGYVVIADSPWIGRADEAGRIALDVPPGRYQLVVWHPRLNNAGQPDRRPVEIVGGKQRLAVSLDLKAARETREFSREALGGG